MQALLKRFSNNEMGATMVEYALLVALIAVVAAAGIGSFGTSINDNLFCMAAAVGGQPCQ